MPFKLGFAFNRRFIGGDRRLDEYVNELQHVESSAKKLFKESKKYVDNAKALVKAEEQVFGTLCDIHTTIDSSSEQMVDDVNFLTKKLNQTREGLTLNYRKIMAEPLHRLNSVFPHANAAITKCDNAFKETEKLQARVDKLLEKTRSSQQDAKLEQNEKALIRARSDFEKQHDTLLADTESFCKNYHEYFDASIEAYFKMQALFYDEYEKSLGVMAGNFDFTPAELDDDDFEDYIKKQLMQLTSHS